MAEQRIIRPPLSHFAEECQHCGSTDIEYFRLSNTDYPGYAALKQSGEIYKTCHRTDPECIEEYALIGCADCQAIFDVTLDI